MVRFGHHKEGETHPVCGPVWLTKVFDAYDALGAVPALASERLLDKKMWKEIHKKIKWLNVLNLLWWCINLTLGDQNIT